tara:strand:- start:33 stop:1178 length:1146 start_codon:yes stop_codon:yes gene_type:complete
VWLGGQEPFLGEDRIRDSFKKYLLISDHDERDDLNELDDIIVEMDELFDNHNMKYTKEHQKYLEENSKAALESIKKESLKELVSEDSISGKTTVGIDWDKFNEEFLVNDIANPSKRVIEEGLPDTSVMSVDAGYTTNNVLERITKENAKVTLEETSRSKKMIVEIDLPVAKEEEPNSKLQFWDRQGVAVRAEKPDAKMLKRKGQTTTFQIDSKKFIEDVDELTLKMTMQKDPDTGKDLEVEYMEEDLEEDMIALLFEDDIKEEFIGKFIPNSMANAYELYDMRLSLTFNLTSRDEEDNMSVKVRAILTPQTKLIPKTGVEERGDTIGERVRGTKTILSGRVSDKKFKVYSQSIKSYFNFITARLRELEEAISDIPESSTEV